MASYPGILLQVLYSLKCEKRDSTVEMETDNLTFRIMYFNSFFYKGEILNVLKISFFFNFELFNYIFSSFLKDAIKTYFHAT